METSVNNKCKAFTSLEQSKKLAEILPLESADMGWYYSRDPQAARNQMWLGTKPENADIPCWSLSALYSILPNNKKETTTLSRGGWKIEPIEYLDNWWCEYEDENDHARDITVGADNAIDACVEMILKLHELKML